VLHPDVDSPFVDEVDVINRLLPYHLFQQPKDDLESMISIKGKEKAVADDLHMKFNVGLLNSFPLVISDTLIKTRNLLWNAIRDARKL
jgi:hypothetical protein